MDDRVRELAARQDDLVADWQLRALGLTKQMVHHRIRRWGWRRVHRGVYVLAGAPLTRRQRWIAATLTTPDSFLSHASAAAHWGFRPYEGSFETITRPGNGGPRRLDGLLVLRSAKLIGETTTHNGIKVTTAARTLIDLATHVDAREIRRAFREAVRLRVLSREDLQLALRNRRGQPGTRLITELLLRYAGVPYERARSDAESYALELLEEAGVDPPHVNTRVAGEEADLCWPERRLIVEIDGPQYHLFPGEDALKQSRWEAAGYTVRRVGSDVVYRQPRRFLGLCVG